MGPVSKTKTKSLPRFMFCSKVLLQQIDPGEVDPSILMGPVSKTKTKSLPRFMFCSKVLLTTGRPRRG